MVVTVFVTVDGGALVVIVTGMVTVTKAVLVDVGKVLVEVVMTVTGTVEVGTKVDVTVVEEVILAHAVVQVCQSVVGQKRRSWVFMAVRHWVVGGGLFGVGARPGIATAPLRPVKIRAERLKKEDEKCMMEERETRVSETNDLYG